MWRKKGRTFEELRKYLEELSVIDTHEHYVGISEDNKELDILRFIAQSSYYPSDLQSASFDFDSDICSFLSDTSIPHQKRYEVWEKYHSRTCHTAYAKALEEGLKACWGVSDLTSKSLLQLQERMQKERTQEFFDKVYKKYKIRAMIVNMALSEVVNGNVEYNKDICRFVFDLPGYHCLTQEAEIQKPEITQALGRRVVTLDDYLEGFEQYLKRCVEFGIVGIKDQTAYRRKIEYKNVCYHRAEEIFNEIISNPRNVYGTNENKDLDDFLFHYFIKLARKYNLPVQLHTGHMAGIRNEITKTNPAHLTNVFELHQEVVFDLFHGSWPYMGELLFLGKNYPNVFIDMCWVNAIDPLYSVELLKRALMTVPHSKISGFGGDTLCPESQVGYLILAKDNIALALVELVEEGWIGLEEAKVIGEAWLFDNPNRIFSLKIKKAK